MLDVFDLIDLFKMDYPDLNDNNFEYYASDFFSDIEIEYEDSLNQYGIYDEEDFINFLSSNLTI